MDHVIVIPLKKKDNKRDKDDDSDNDPPKMKFKSEPHVDFGHCPTCGRYQAKRWGLFYCNSCWFSLPLSVRGDLFTLSTQTALGELLPNDPMLICVNEPMPEPVHDTTSESDEFVEHDQAPRNRGRGRGRGSSRIAPVRAKKCSNRGRGRRG